MKKGVADMNRRWVNIPLVFMFTFLLIFPFTKGALAHAVLIEADPPLNSQVMQAPTEIRYVFNERVEKELFYIRLYDSEGEQVTKNQAEISENQREISLKLPSLKEGTYTVTYHILSGDGHPVEQSSILTIGTSSKQPSPWYMNNVINQGHHAGISADRMLYYCSLIFLGGWLFWGMFFSFTEQTDQSIYRKWLHRFRHFFLIALNYNRGDSVFIVIKRLGIHKFCSLIISILVGIDMADLSSFSYIRLLDSTKIKVDGRDLDSLASISRGYFRTCDYI